MKFKKASEKKISEAQSRSGMEAGCKLQRGVLNADGGRSD